MRPVQRDTTTGCDTATIERNGSGQRPSRSRSSLVFYGSGGAMTGLMWNAFATHGGLVGLELLAGMLLTAAFMTMGLIGARD